jgi:hypothetical protein
MTHPNRAYFALWLLATALCFLTYTPILGAEQFGPLERGKFQRRFPHNFEFKSSIKRKKIRGSVTKRKAAKAQESTRSTGSRI